MYRNTAKPIQPPEPASPIDDPIREILEIMLNQFDYHDHEAHKEVVTDAATAITRLIRERIVQELEYLVMQEQWHTNNDQCIPREEVIDRLAQLKQEGE